MLRCFCGHLHKVILEKMARLFTTTRSLDSLQPRKEPRHGHGRQFGPTAQEMDQWSFCKRYCQTPPDARGHCVSDAFRKDVMLASGRSCTVRCTPSSANQSLSGAAALEKTQYQLHPSGEAPGTSSQGWTVCIHHRCHVGQPSWEENREYLQHWQPPAAATKTTSLWQAETQPQELSQLHDGSVNHSLGHSN